MNVALKKEACKPFFENNEPLPPVLAVEFVSKYARLKFYAPNRDDEDYIDILRNDNVPIEFDKDDPRMRMVTGPGSAVVREEEQKKILTNNYQHFGKTLKSLDDAVSFSNVIEEKEDPDYLKSTVAKGFFCGPVHKIAKGIIAVGCVDMSPEGYSAYQDLFINDKDTPVVNTILANVKLKSEIAAFAGKKNKDKLIADWRAKAEEYTQKAKDRDITIAEVKALFDLIKVSFPSFRANLGHNSDVLKDMVTAAMARSNDMVGVLTEAADVGGKDEAELREVAGAIDVLYGVLDDSAFFASSEDESRYLAESKAFVSEELRRAMTAKQFHAVVKG